MTAVQFAFLKEGWIQIGAQDIPVFFRYEPQDEHYPFHVIFTGDKHAYYDMYNEWVQKGLITVDNIPVESIVRGAFEHLRSTGEMFHIGIMTWLSDFYYHHSRTDYANQQAHMRESENYRYIYQYLAKQKKPDIVIKEKEILKPELS